MSVVGVTEEYVAYADMCFIPSHYETVVVGNTTRSVCRSLCSEAYSLKCSAFLYSRQLLSCTITPFTGESVQGSRDISTLERGCNDSTLEFYRRIRHLSMLQCCVLV